MWNEFKTFILRGNVLDLAIGVIIGAAFGKIVTSLVEDVIMPPIGFLLHGVDFSSLYLDLSGKGYASLQAAKSAGAPVIGYGMFLNSLISFLIVATVIFFIIKGVNRITQKEAAVKEPPAQEKLLVEIRDLLKSRSP